MKKNNADKYTTIIGCLIIMFIHSGINGVATAAMPQLKIHYNTNLTSIIGGASICCLTMFLGSFFGEKFIRTVTPKIALFCGSLCGFIFSILVSYSTKIGYFYLGCSFAGLMVAWGTYATCNVFILNMTFKRKGFFISTLTSMAMLGSASFQFTTGRILKIYTIRELYLIMSAISIIAMAINILMIKNPKIELDKNICKDKTNEKGAVSIRSEESIYSNSLFWIIAFVAFLGSALCGTFGSLLTTFLQGNGISAVTSTTYLSLYTLIAGLLALLSGYILDRFGWIFYVIYLYSAYILGITLALIWSTTFHQRILIIIMIVLMAMAVPCSTIYNMISEPLFKKEALLANTKLMSISSLGSTVLLPICSKICELYGFSFIWLFLIITAFICMLLLLYAIYNMKK